MIELMEGFPAGVLAIEANKGFGFMIPAEVQVFELAELDAAKTWIAGDR